jgi:hypothetical protein
VAIVTRNAKGPAIVTRNERGAKDQPEQTPGAKRMASTVEKLAWPAGPANEVDNETTLAPPSSPEVLVTNVPAVEKADGAEV